jgi:hypothetical protein
LQKDQNLFLHPGYRGVEVLPYPKHVKEMIRSVDDKIKLYQPKHKHGFY